MDSTLIFALVLVGLFALLGLWLFWDHAKKQRKFEVRHPARAEGTVVEWVEHSRETGGLLSGAFHKGEALLFPVVRFTLDGAKGVRFRDKKGFPKESLPFEIGQSVSVVYDRDNPLLAEIVYDQNTQQQ